MTTLTKIIVLTTGFTDFKVPLEKTYQKSQVGKRKRQTGWEGREKNEKRIPFGPVVKVFSEVLALLWKQPHNFKRRVCFIARSQRCFDTVPWVPVRVSQLRSEKLLHGRRTPGKELTLVLSEAWIGAQTWAEDLPKGAAAARRKICPALGLQDSDKHSQGGTKLQERQLALALF